MTTNLYIPKTIKVGFQEREDTFTGKLAYVIYTDDVGKLRKEKSWTSWRSKKIEPLDFDNVPTDGFMINRDVQRYNWSWFSSNRSYIRVHDPRGFEFEISPENLIGILMSGDCLKRVLDGKFVYSWSGTDLVLLPESSENYADSVKFTENKIKKVASKDLKPGFIYRTKTMEEVVFVGRLPKEEDAYRRYYWSTVDKVKTSNNKYWQPDINYNLTTSTNVAHIAECISDSHHPDFANIYDIFDKNSNFNKKRKVTHLEFAPIENPENGIDVEYNEWHKKFIKSYSVSFYAKDIRPDYSDQYLKYQFSLARNVVDGVVENCETWNLVSASKIEPKVDNSTTEEKIIWEGRYYKVSYYDYSLVDENPENKKMFKSLKKLTLDQMVEMSPHYMITCFEENIRVPDSVYRRFYVNSDDSVIEHL